MSKRMKKAIYIIGIAICAILLVVSAGVLISKWWKDHQAEKRYDELANMRIETDTENDTEASSEEVDIFTQLGLTVPVNNYDWKAIREVNEHIYAWIYVPNTNIDYPIFQHPTDDTYYLHYDMSGYNGSYGGIFSESAYNGKDFTDFHTVLYGHNLTNGGMFRTLHNFEDKTFFDENQYIYIFTPEGTYVYQIYAAYTNSNEHLLANYSYQNKAMKQSYLDKTITTAQSTGFLRDGVEISTNAPILTLSTCIYGTSSKRYIVQGVLLATDVTDL